MIEMGRFAGQSDTEPPILLADPRGLIDLVTRQPLPALGDIDRNQIQLATMSARIFGSVVRTDVLKATMVLGIIGRVSGGDIARDGLRCSITTWERSTAHFVVGLSRGGTGAIRRVIAVAAERVARFARRQLSENHRRMKVGVVCQR
jgi:hypothetical protein